MPVSTRESTAGTGEQSIDTVLTNIVLVGVTLSNPNETDRAEASQIRLYSGPSASGINFLELSSGWTVGNHSINWSGRLNLLGSYTLRGLINHASSIKHRLTIQTEPKEAMPQGMWNWPEFWKGRRG